MSTNSFESVATKSWPVPVEQGSGMGLAEPVLAIEMASDKASPLLVEVGIVLELELWA